MAAGAAVSAGGVAAGASAAGGSAGAGISVGAGVSVAAGAAAGVAVAAGSSAASAGQAMMHDALIAIIRLEATAKSEDRAMRSDVMRRGLLINWVAKFLARFSSGVIWVDIRHPRPSALCTSACRPGEGISARRCPEIPTCTILVAKGHQERCTALEEKAPPLRGGEPHTYPPA